MKTNKLSQKLLCMLLVIALVLIPCTAFASSIALNKPSNAGLAVGNRIMTWDVMVNQIHAMAELCDDMEVCTIADVFGNPEFTSEAGMPLYFVKAGHGDKVVWLEAQIHGNEKLTSMGLMELLWEYAKDENLRADLEDLTIYAIPIYNVDGSRASYTSAGVPNYNNAQRGTCVWNANGTVRSSNLDLNRDWNFGLRGNPVAFVAKESRAYFRLWADIMPDIAIDMHHQNTVSFGTPSLPYTMSLGTALNASGPRTPAVADPVGEGLLSASATSNNIFYAITLPFLRDYEVQIKQQTKYVFDQIAGDVRDLFVYPSGTNAGQPYTHVPINIYPGVDVYGGAVSGMMLGVNYNNWNPYQYTCPAWFWEVEQQTNNNTTNLTARYIAIAWQSYYGAKAVCYMIANDDFDTYDPDTYWDMPYATSGTFSAISTTYGTDRNHRLPPVDFSPLDYVKAGIKADAVSGVEDNVEFNVEIFQPKDVLAVELEFNINGPIAGVGVEGINGFEPMTEIFWVYGGNDTWKGSVTMKYEAGGDSTGYTHKKLSDIAKFVYAPIAEGEAAMTLTGFRVVGIDGDTTKYIRSEITIPSATTTIEQLIWSKYDLNKDNIVDALDLGIMLLYCGFDSDSPDWANLVKVNDSRGRPVTASMCDVNCDGVIDMLDLLDLFIHYTK
ncbi:MAG: dockerin type I domain-containing protein [Clostridiales bacterium]|nr:dockerin type I domain-containing protein [Clostridiales bacterium]